MSFLTPALLAGAALIALPIVLHLVMRQEPQRLVFPAMRFIQRRRATNQTRMRLQHWLLLALRCAAIGLLALALARPVWQSSDGRGEAEGLAVAVVIDNSPRMGYLLDNRTRLAAAQESAEWLVGQLPEESQVAVLDLGGIASRRLAKRDSAAMRAERIAIRAAARPLGDAVADAVAMVGEVEDARREVYVYTDLTLAAWNDAARAQLRDALERSPGTRVYLIDVGVRLPINRGLGAVELSSDSPRVGQSLAIRANVLSTADAANASSSNEPTSVELWLSESSEPPEKRGEAILNPGETAAVFNLASLGEGVHQGYLRLVGSDPLAIDDTRYFTVAVEPARPLLVAAAEEREAIFVREAIAPSAAGAAPRQTLEFRRFDELGPVNYDDYAGVLLLDPPGLEDDAWRRLAAFARRGGSVATFLGRRASRSTHNGAAPQQLLPGPLKRRSRSATYLRPTSYRHGSLNQMADFAEQIPWSRFPVFESWDFESLAPDASVVVPMADDRPALIERPVGEGWALTLVTPVSDSASRHLDGNGPWNLLPTGDDPWPFVLMMGNLADYLVGAGELRRNFAAGEPAVVPTPPGAASSGFVLRLPSGEAARQPTPVDESEVVVGITDEVGNYRLLAGGATGRLDTGFSVNALPDVGNLERVEFATIADEVGKDRVQLATTRDELARDVARGRVGREFYPYLIVLVAGALAAEQWVANRFYRTSSA